jgi:hypothetical protein
MVYEIPWVMGRANAQRATAGAPKNSLPTAWPLNLPRVTPDERLTGIAWPVTLSGSAVSCHRLPVLSDRYGGTDHQAFDPHRDNRHFKRGSICGLLGRLGASRVLGRLRGPIQRVTLSVVTSWAGAGRQLRRSSIVSAASPRRPRSAASCRPHASLASGLPRRNDL